MRKFLSITIFAFLVSCTSASQFGAGVNITFDPRTIGMQIDDTIMQKNLSARLALTDKKYFLSIQSEVLDGRIFLSGKVEEPEEKIKILSANLSAEQKHTMIAESKKVNQKTPVEWVAVMFSPDLTVKQVPVL